MPYLIRAVALGTGEPLRDGVFFATIDPDWQPDGYDPEQDPIGPRAGAVDLTDDLSAALRFDTAADAWEAWRARSTRVPTRPDGKPNRPGTAYTVEVVSEDGYR